MKTYTFEGKEYIAKEDVDGLVRDRIRQSFGTCANSR